MLRRLEKKVSGTPKALQPFDYAASAEQSKGNTAMAIGGMKALAGVGMGALKLYGGGGTGGDAVFGDVSQYTPKTDMAGNWAEMTDFTKDFDFSYGNYATTASNYAAH